MTYFIHESTASVAIVASVSCLMSHNDDSILSQAGDLNRCKKWHWLQARIFAAISPQMITIDQVQGIWSEQSYCANSSGKTRGKIGNSRLLLINLSFQSAWLCEQKSIVSSLIYFPHCRCLSLTSGSPRASLTCRRSPWTPPPPSSSGGRSTTPWLPLGENSRYLYSSESALYSTRMELWAAVCVILLTYFSRWKVKKCNLDFFLAKLYYGSNGHSRDDNDKFSWSLHNEQ